MELKRAISDSWNTPRYIVDLVLQLWPDIDVDPMSNRTSIVPATVRYTARRDGLAHPWQFHSQRRSRVYVNPPYDHRMLARVERRCAQEEAAGGAEILLLVPVKSDQAWFQRALGHATAVCFIRGRVKFGTAGVGAAFSSCLFYWGDEASRFAKVFEPLGKVLFLSR